MVYDIGIVRRRRVIQQGDAFFNNVVAAAGYVGPGDVVAGATGWWGLRAYTAASIGANAVRLREDGGNTEQNFATIAGGGLDLAAIATFKGANSLFVTKLYDQSGGGAGDLLQATAGSQPSFILSGLGSLPVIRFNGFYELVTGGVTLSQPMTIGFVAKRTAAFTSTQGIGANAGGTPRAGFLSSADTVFAYAGTLISVSKADNNFYAVQAAFNGASSDLNIDGTANAGNAGTDTLFSRPFSTTSDAITNGDAVEYGLWSVAFTGGNSSAMSANQHAYWGF